MVRVVSQMPYDIEISLVNLWVVVREKCTECDVDD